MDVVLLSGGWDSAACLVRALPAHPTALFADYGQPYLAPERLAVKRLAARFGVPLVAATLPPLDAHQGVFDQRNERLLLEAIALGATVVHVGVRNPFWFLDRFHDSNWSWVRAMRRKHRVEIRALIGWPKWLVRRVACSGGVLAEEVFSTEGLS